MSYFVCFLLGLEVGAIGLFLALRFFSPKVVVGVKPMTDAEIAEFKKILKETPLSWRIIPNKKR